MIILVIISGFKQEVQRYPIYLVRYVTFLSLNKKVTKEISIGEALNVTLPRAKAALSYVPLQARIAVAAVRVTLNPVQAKNVPIFLLEG